MIPIIPFPAEILLHKERPFIFSQDVALKAGNEFHNLLDYIDDWTLLFLGYKLRRNISTSSNNSVTLSLEPNLAIPEEGYQLNISSNFISIRGSSIQGIFYGIQSFLQFLLLSKGKDKIKIPAMLIKDYPRFEWRGFMLDVSRHYHPIETIKKLIQLMGFLKLNRFHWHFNDDQGWRIEIKSHPKLTSVGSKRKDTQIGGFFSKSYRGQSHEGFYTQEEVKDVIEFARQRFIQVIPELELPGHCSAVLASYPNLCCTGREIEVKSRFRIHRDIYCAGKETTYKFLETIINQITEIFPSEIIHIGGDESPKKRWKMCPKCQEMEAKEGLKDEDELYYYFVNRIIKFLAMKGKIGMGWNQILNSNINKTSIIQWWLGRKSKLLKGLRSGRKFVMSPISHAYLDYNYLLFPLRNFYKYDPIPKKLDEYYQKNIIGIEATLWTEWVPNLERLGWQVFPRLFATAEVAWSLNLQKNYGDFKKRVPMIYRYLDSIEMPYADLNETDPTFLKRIFNLHRWLKWPKI